ncbi:class A beta-lactamase [Agromyces atrinae]|uniref:class A beta-lactamase n=1 Tax=Agromyces atrinae TaxID=592376 RepID=UPI001F565065|nr:class A beta-lactamase [Agromyces atrinae]MCI2956356.1 class A beta-lactamase [Agromyces atrinae]
MSVRRRFAALSVIGVLVLGGCSATPDAVPPSSSAAPVVSPSPPSPTVLPNVGAIDAALEQLEVDYSAAVGIAAIDTRDDVRFSFNADERFGFASTIKLFVAAQFLRAVPADQRGERVFWTADDIQAAGYSPVTEQHIDDGLTYAELAEAAVRQSDNTATNLVLARIGGPAALDAALAELGDETTSVVNVEPDLNRIEPGSTDDTTTAAAFTAGLEEVVVGDALNDDDRAMLLDWMSGNATGDALIRAGAPEGWVVADKSGGAAGMRNDIAIVIPPGRQPIVISVLTARLDPEQAYDDALVAEVARVVLDGFR